MRQLTAGQAGRLPAQDRPFICGDQVLRTKTEIGDAFFDPHLWETLDG